MKKRRRAHGRDVGGGLGRKIALRMVDAFLPGASSLDPLTGARRLFRFAWKEQKSRRILIFLGINVTFMFVEVAVGFWTNSLGLISDAGHMFFDCIALFIGLYASYMSHWSPDGTYSYGYDVYEVLSGFLNGIFLIFIAVLIVGESLERLSEPPDLSMKGLLTTSVLGLLVNLVGLAFFHEHAHSHGGGETCSHGHSHGGDSNMQAPT